jgi:hypothetical protein
VRRHFDLLALPPSAAAKRRRGVSAGAPLRARRPLFMTDQSSSARVSALSKSLGAQLARARLGVLRRARRFFRGR